MPAQIPTWRPLGLISVVCGLLTHSVPAQDADTPYHVTWAQPAWSHVTLGAIQASSLPGVVPSDVDLYCPSYAKLDPIRRSEFWLSLVSAIALRESNLNPHDQYQESFPDVAHIPVISRGLLQLSIESANQSKYACQIGVAEDLHDPIINLRCGVRIMAALVSDSKAIAQKPLARPWRGAAAYWSVLRKPSTNTKIQKFSTQNPVCRA